MDEKGLTSTDILAAATDALCSSGYARVGDTRESAQTPSARLFEDPYGIVAVVVYETWEDLSSRWPDAQAWLVDVISKSMSSSEAKAWEGYLVLLTPSVVGTSAHTDADRIRYDTARVRKLVATGEELRNVGDVHRALLPLLALDDVGVGKQESTLEMLPDLLSKKGHPRRAVLVVVNAFRDQLPILEKLHDYRSKE